MVGQVGDLPAGYAFGMGEYVREYPQWPWKEWGDLEPDKARMEMAIHRAEAAKLDDGEPREWCGGCGHRTRFQQVGEPVPSPWPTGRLRVRVECVKCGHKRPWSFHPDPIRVPGLT